MKIDTVSTQAGDTITGDTMTGDTMTGDTMTGDTMTGDTMTGDTMTGDTMTGDTMTGDTMTGDTMTGDTMTGDTMTGDIFVTAAEEIAARICRDAIWAGDRCNWVSPTKEYIDSRTVVIHRALGPNLYAGSGGVALFLAHAYQATGERVFRVCAQGALAHSLSQVEHLPHSLQISYYSGLLGIADTLLRAGALLADRALAEAGMALARRAASQPPSPQGLDVIAGSASGIPALLRLYAEHGEQKFLDAAHLHGEMLLLQAERGETGASWKSVSEDLATHNLCGFAHGSAGIGLALLELFVATGDLRFRAVGDEAFRYEEHCYLPEEANYPDFRTGGLPAGALERSKGHMMAWCHGAPGVGIARTRAWALLRNAAYRAQAERAAHATLHHLQTLLEQPAANYCLCHGVAGNAAFLFYAGRLLGNNALLHAAADAARRGIVGYTGQRLPWPCGLADGGETPTLMLGSAGIGLFLLSLQTDRLLAPIMVC